MRNRTALPREAPTARCDASKSSKARSTSARSPQGVPWQQVTEKTYGIRIKEFRPRVPDPLHRRRIAGRAAQADRGRTGQKGGAPPGGVGGAVLEPECTRRAYPPLGA